MRKKGIKESIKYPCEEFFISFLFQLRQRGQIFYQAVQSYADTQDFFGFNEIDEIWFVSMLLCEQVCTWFL